MPCVCPPSLSTCHGKADMPTSTRGAAPEPTISSPEKISTARSPNENTCQLHKQQAMPHLPIAFISVCPCSHLC
jgi:hypothetical protein